MSVKKKFILNIDEEEFDNHLTKTALGLHHIGKPANKVLYNKHKGRKNNEVVAAMYAMYTTPDLETGKTRSLTDIGKAYRKSRQAIYDLFKTRGYQLRSKELKGLQVLDGHKFTLTRDGYLRGTINKKRVLMHVYVWEKYKGKLSKDYCIYHIDKNKENNNLSNLDIIHKSKMSAYFNPNGNNQYTKKH